MDINNILIIRAIYTGLLTGIAIAIPMGPAGFESVRWTISKGFKQGVKVAAGSLIADAIDVILINFGLLELIETNKILEVSFWIISGIIIFLIGYKALKKSKGSKPQKEEQVLVEKNSNSRALFTGFIVNFSNPMTHFFWLTLSSTVIRIWRSYGKFVYFIFALFMLCGMFISLFTINFLASHGKKFTTPKVSGKFENILSYVIVLFGIGFIVNGLYKLSYFLVK
ncbi:LysE family translocator [Clostridium prolinivorans]|uniref:LysE family translocator n=1 Tax=Clostridium prolinivorans TaxID=2769420 RepID=UPI000FDACAF3|nr:LysE family transporter [Clostridium prolinivorans]